MQSEEMQRLYTALRFMYERLVQLEQFQESLIVAMGPELGGRYRNELTIVQGKRADLAAHDSLLQLIAEGESL